MCLIEVWRYGLFRFRVVVNCFGYVLVILIKVCDGVVKGESFGLFCIVF